jgi:hypothetical protein
MPDSPPPTSGMIEMINDGGSVFQGRSEPMVNDTGLRLRMQRSQSPPTKKKTV